MRIADYRITEEADGIIVDGVTNFVPAHVFENGQSFRWKKEVDDGSYTGVVRGKVANINYVDERLFIRNAMVDDFHLLWFHYFDLSENYSEVEAQLLSTDPVLAEPIRYGKGLRMLKQEFWEVLVSYILSARSSISRIVKSIDDICVEYGNPVVYQGRKFHAFPSPEQVVNGGEDMLKRLKMGLSRAEDIFSAAEALVHKKIDVQSLGTQPDVEVARRELQKLHGVGPKIADCTLSFSGMRKDVFPTDRWIERIMRELYGQQFANEAAVYRYAEQRYGTLMSYAQGYLFYYAYNRKTKIGIS
jgi:N-glycosylase/DNA lyase